MNKRVSPSLIGAFVVSGIVLVVVAVVIIGSGRAFRDTRAFVSHFSGSVNGLGVGSTVSFRGVPVGTVKEILLSMDGFDTARVGQDIGIPVVFELDENLLRSRGAPLDLTDPAAVQVLMDRGISTQLQTESLLTGRLFIALDFRPDAEKFTYGGNLEYLEVPSVASPMTEVRNQLNELADGFVNIDVRAVVEQLAATLEGVNDFITSEDIQDLPTSMSDLVGSLDGTLETVQALAVNADSAVYPMRERLTEAAVRAEESMDEVDETLETLQGVVEPGGPLILGLVQTLQELELAARSLRRVAELIERDPSVLVRGRATSGGGS